ncbi:molybdopterin-dependent oxidoreductase [Frigidibacter sp. MR17.24]|uniref:molybdopterin-dependent oxidoreductase n=1 Tax=Frigidibacter sp. MR17.24 TaxID=3127345 RepID=UPI003013068F
MPRAEVYTSCTLDCPDGCGILATVEDGRVTALAGHPDHAFTRGFLCAKTYRYPARVYADDRQLHPLIRREGRTGPWSRATWDEALDLIAARIRALVARDGPLAILHYQRTGSWGATKLLNRRFWNLLGGATSTRGSLCSGAARAGQAMDFGTRLGHDPADLANSRIILLWGRNPLVTNLHLVPPIKAARAAGARVVLVDPVRSESATLCDAHVQPAVARDAELALGMARVILEEGLEDRAFVTDHVAGFEDYRALVFSRSVAGWAAAAGVAIGTLRALARDYATLKPASIQLGWGLNKYRHSAEIFRCIDALAAIAGHVGRAGGGVTHGFDTRRHFAADIEGFDTAAHRRTIPEPMLGRALLETRDPPIGMVMVNGGNPVNQSPNSDLVARGLAAVGFTVVMDTVLTDTCDHADVFLPSTTFFEEEDVLVSWGHNLIGGVNPVIAPPGEARSDLRMYQDLARRLGLAGMEGSPRDWLGRILAPMEAAGLPVDRVMAGPQPCPTAPMVPFADRRFPTASGRVELIGSLPETTRAVPGFPLVLITTFEKKWLLSQIAPDEHPDRPAVRVHPDTAAACGAPDGGTVRIVSPAGALAAVVRHDPRVGPGIVLATVGTWIKRGGGVNRLTEDRMTNFGEMAAYGDTRVRLEPLAAAADTAGRAADDAADDAVGAAAPG